MPESSFAESREMENDILGPWTRQTQAILLLINVLPFCHVLFVIAGTVWINGFLAKGAFAAAGIYLIPPLLVRLLFTIRPVPKGNYSVNSPEFLIWWASAQSQVLYCRFPFLEELLRMVPGLYSTWLRLWGARIGRLTYWAPEVRILDRSFLEIGDNVIFGAGVRLNPHVIAPDERAITRLSLGIVQIGDYCRIGGYSLLTAGTVVEPGQILKAFSLSPPFATWRDGKRTKAAIPQ